VLSADEIEDFLRQGYELRGLRFGWKPSIDQLTEHQEELTGKD
jgi:hypothetical protein